MININEVEESIIDPQDERLVVMKEYYDRIHAAIRAKNLKLANKILYEETPVGIYDLSINMIDRMKTLPANIEKTELQLLLLKVDRALNKSVKEQDPDIIDNFNGMF